MGINLLVLLSTFWVSAASISITPEGFIYLPCSINGFSGSCLLDTGAANSSMHKKVTKGFPRGWALETGLSGGWPNVFFKYAVKNYSVLGQSVAIAKMTAEKDFPFPNPPSNLIGVVGNDALQGKALKIDMRSQTAEFVSPGQNRLCVSFEWAAGAPYMEVRGPSGQMLHAILDLAAGNSILKGRLVSLADSVKESGTLTDAVGKQVPVRLGILRVSLLGKREELNVLVLNQDMAPDRPGKPVDLIIGLDYLSSKVFTLDFQNQRLCME